MRARYRRGMLLTAITEPELALARAIHDTREDAAISQGYYIRLMPA